MSNDPMRPLKQNNISAAAYPTALNLVSNKSLDIARLHDG